MSATPRHSPTAALTHARGHRAVTGQRRESKWSPSHTTDALSNRFNQIISQQPLQAEQLDAYRLQHIAVLHNATARALNRYSRVKPAQQVRVLVRVIITRTLM